MSDGSVSSRLRPRPVSASRTSAAGANRKTSAGKAARSASTTASGKRAGSSAASSAGTSTATSAGTDAAISADAAKSAAAGAAISADAAKSAAAGVAISADAAKSAAAGAAISADAAKSAAAGAAERAGISASESAGTTAAESAGTSDAASAGTSAKSAETVVGERASGSSQAGNKGAAPPKGKRQKRVVEVKEWVDDEDQPWRLPDLVLVKVMAYLCNEDVVSAGQTCSNWRRAARFPEVWRHRSVEYWVTDPSNPRYTRDWHGNARSFSRVVRFAPCLAMVRCNRGMKGRARKALYTQSKCQPRAVKMNGKLVATVKYVRKWQESIESLALENPTLDLQKLVLTLPRLVSLSVSSKFDNYDQHYEIPALPAGVDINSSLKRLEISTGVPGSAARSLVQAVAGSLETLTLVGQSLQAGMPDALASCKALRHLTVDLRSPDVDGPRLRELLRQRADGAAHPSLERLRLESLGKHKKDACLPLRNSLESDHLVLVGCSSCSCGEPGYTFYPGNGGGSNMYDYQFPFIVFGGYNDDFYDEEYDDEYDDEW